MRIAFFIENNRHGRGSADLKAKQVPFLETELPAVPEDPIQIDGVWYETHYKPHWIFMDGRLFRVEVFIKPSGGQALIDWSTDKEPYKSENRGDETIP